MTDDTLRTAFDRLHAASRREPAPDHKTRRDRLMRLRAMIADHTEAFAEAISADFGVRSKTETRLLEVAPIYNAIRHARSHLRAWMKPSPSHVDMSFLPSRAWVRHEPLGVVGIISPWNYPLQLALSPLVDVLAAGNRALIKPSELTPRFSDLLQEIVAKTYSPEEVAVVTGGPDVAAAFSALPFDHLIFTGSTSIGRKVMAAAAPNLTPVTLELGGKSPAIVCEDYDMQKAAHSIAFGKFLNAGQTCIAPDYVLAPKARTRPLAEALLAHARSSYPTLADNDDYTAIISPRHYDRLANALADAREKGATALQIEDPAAAQQRKLPPTVLLDTPPDSLFLTEEIFGPVLPVVGYDSLEEALDFVNAHDRPLALYAFSNSSRTREHILDRAISGGVTLNGTLLHIAQDSMPFGGVGASGIGAYHGYEGFKRFSHARAVFETGFLNVFERLGPPWGAAADLVVKTMARR